MPAMPLKKSGTPSGSEEDRARRNSLIFPDGGELAITQTTRDPPPRCAEDHFRRRSSASGASRPHMQSAVTQPARAAELSAPPISSSNVQSVRQWQRSRGSGGWTEPPSAQTRSAPLRERAAVAGRTRALSPRGQLAQLTDILSSLDSCVEGTKTRPRLAPEHFRRHRSDQQYCVSVDVPIDSGPQPMRRHRSQPADDLPKKQVRPIRSSVSLVPEHPMRQRRSASLRLHDVDSPVGDKTSLDRKGIVTVQLASARPHKNTSDNTNTAYCHPRRHLHAPTTPDFNSNTRLVEWWHKKLERSHALGITSVDGCPLRRSADCWWHACRQALVVFWNSIWAALAVITSLLPSWTCRYARARQPKVDMAEVSCEFKAAQTDLHACKEEYVRCKSALVRAEKRFARAAAKTTVQKTGDQATR